MGNIADAFDAAFRDFVVDGVPASGINPPAKADCRALGATIEANVDDSIVAQTVADGTTDDTAAIQTCIDANKGKRIIIPANSTFAGVLLSGSGYNGTTIACNGEVNFLPGGSSPNFGGAYVAIIVQSCSNVTILLDMNGNRAGMTQNEHILCVGIAGATNFKVIGKCREIRGDGVYVNQSNWTSSSSQSIGGYIEIEGYNSAPDGRNLVSLISCQGVQVRAWSWDIGGVVNSADEPGGVDIEPDQTYQSVHDFDVDAFVYCSGAVVGGVQIIGLEVTGGQRDYNVYDGRIRATLRATSVLTGASGNFLQCRRLNIDLDVAGTGSAPKATEINAVDDSVFRIKARNTHGIVIAFTDFLNSSDVFLDIEDCVAPQSVLLVGHNNCRFHGSIANPSGASIAVDFYDNSRGLTPSYNIYELFISDTSGNLTHAYNNHSGNAIASFTSCAIANGSLASAINAVGLSAVFAGTFTGLNRINVHGLNQQTAQPASGSWTQGDYVSNKTPALASSKVTIGWSRLTTGTGNVTNTDWAAQVVPNS